MYMIMAFLQQIEWRGKIGRKKSLKPRNHNNEKKRNPKKKLCQETEFLSVLLCQPNEPLDLLCISTDLLAEILDHCTHIQTDNTISIATKKKLNQISEERNLSSTSTSQLELSHRSGIYRHNLGVLLFLWRTLTLRMQRNSFAAKLVELFRSHRVPYGSY